MHPTQHIFDIIVLLGAAVFVVAFFRFLRLSPVLGYLVAGAAIGPYGFKIIEETKQTGAIAEFGVVFLLFMIGLELSWERLKAMRKQVFGFGSLQVLVTGAVIGMIALGFGASPELAIIIGGALALSSTAVVLQVLQESGEKASQVGRLSFAVLLLQDLAVVPLLVLVPLLAGSESQIIDALLNAGGRAIIALVLIFVVGRVLLRPLFRMVAALHNEELFAAFTLLVVLGTAWATAEAGLSLALGAFIAGLLVAETEYHHQVEADIKPYKGLFLGLFFMSVGMQVDVGLMRDSFWMILGGAVALIVTKAAIMICLCRLFHFRLGASLHTGLMVAQGGEFAFVLFGLAAGQGIIESQLSQILMVIVTASMALTPLISQLGKKLADRIDNPATTTPVLVNEETYDLRDHVIIAGYGRIGAMVARLLQVESKNYIILDSSPARVMEGRKRGKPVYYGDSSRLDVLQSVGIDRAACVMITIDNPDVALKTVAEIRSLYPDLPIIARSWGAGFTPQLKEAGATTIVSETFEASLMLGGAVLKAVGIPDYEISRIVELHRAENYALTRAEAEREGGDLNFRPEPHH
jgi:CPA2 family monovalent cation:H+ antiporter-2